MLKLNVIFENSNGFFFEGEKLSARLEVCVDQPVNIDYILANFVGFCTCRKDSIASFKSKTKLNADNEKEVYFDDILPLFTDNTSERTTFQEGIHLYSVQYQLPASLPTSFESPDGSIRYMMQVIAEVGGEVVKKTHYFTVVSKIDLNKEATASLPIVVWKHDSQCLFSFLCMRNEQTRAFAHIWKKGYVPGEYITINAEVRNLNRHPINWVKACIVQVLKYHSVKVFKRKRVVAELTRGCILPYQNQAWRSESILIPAVPPTTSPPNRMINIKYKLVFLIKTSWQEKTISLKQSLLIGTVPLMEVKEVEERGQGEGESAIQNDSCHGSNLEPCIFGPHTIQEDDAVSSFSPLYPVFTELSSL